MGIKLFNLERVTKEDFEKLESRIRSRIRKKATKASWEEIRDLADETIYKCLRAKPGDVPMSYFYTAAENAANDHLRMEDREGRDPSGTELDQLASNSFRGSEPVSLPKGKAAPGPADPDAGDTGSIIQALSSRHPEKMQALYASLELIELLYFLKRNLAAAQSFIIPMSATINALQTAKDEIDKLGHFIPLANLARLHRQYRKTHPLPAGCPDFRLPADHSDAMEAVRREYQAAWSYPKELARFNRDHFFYAGRPAGEGISGSRISAQLGKNIRDLKDARRRELEGPGTSPRDFFQSRITDSQMDSFLDEFVAASLTKLRAEPLMLLLRVCYKLFRIGSGKYAARDRIWKLVLELKAARGNSKQAFIFESATETTNFETLRKKLYRKSKDRMYDQLADRIVIAALANERPPSGSK